MLKVLGVDECTLSDHEAQKAATALLLLSPYSRYDVHCCIRIGMHPIIIVERDRERERAFSLELIVQSDLVHGYS